MRFLSFLREYLYVHNYWATISVQNYYATKSKTHIFPSHFFIFICLGEKYKQLKTFKLTFLTFKKIKNKKSVTNIATLLFNSSDKHSIHGVCQFLDLLMINFLRSSNHSRPDTVQSGVLFSFTLSLPFKKAPQVLNWV